VGLVWASDRVPDLTLKATHWKVSEDDAIQNVLPQFILDNENFFPDRVIRDVNGDLVEVVDTKINFGSIDVSGIDYQVSYGFGGSISRWSTSLSATQTYRYKAAFVPAAPAVDAVSKAQDSGNWAPRWKGTAMIDWKGGPISVHLAGRYVGEYQDYGREDYIGNVWIWDANIRCELGPSLPGALEFLHGTHIELGAVNLFNKLPQFSSYNGSMVGYDPSQADIRGRFGYVRLGVKW
jgi:iron complex outermembrane receptor protein